MRVGVWVGGPKILNVAPKIERRQFLMFARFQIEKISVAQKYLVLPRKI